MDGSGPALHGIPAPKPGFLLKTHIQHGHLRGHGRCGAIFLMFDHMVAAEGRSHPGGPGGHSLLPQKASRGGAALQEPGTVRDRPRPARAPLSLGHRRGVNLKARDERPETSRWKRIGQRDQEGHGGRGWRGGRVGCLLKTQRFLFPGLWSCGPEHMADFLCQGLGVGPFRMSLGGRKQLGPELGVPLWAWPATCPAWLQ